MFISHVWYNIWYAYHLMKQKPSFAITVTAMSIVATSFRNDALSNQALCHYPAGYRDY
jgi:hypothetical protein